MPKAIVIVLDGVGVGGAPDVAKYHDEGSDTLGNLSRELGGIDLPNMQRLGLGNIIPIEGVPPTATPTASWGRMIEQSEGKDSTSGHWELGGVILDQVMPTYPDGFPPEIIEKFIETIDVDGILGNKVASGTVIIEELGQEHVETGLPIVYTSADSVFQIAAHVDIIPLPRLYEWCEKARTILTGRHAVSRVIARPFATDQSGEFYRTVDRKDFSLKPFHPTILELAKDAGYVVTGIGKIEDLYAFQGLTRSYHTHTNDEGIRKIIEIAAQQENGLVFVNLVDTDQLYGHRNNCEGFYGALKQFDDELPAIIDALHTGDIVFITADHGNDPTTPSTDHSREMVPIIAFSDATRPADLGTRQSFADLGQTIAEFLKTKPTRNGTSFLRQML